MTNDTDHIYTRIKQDIKKVYDVHKHKYWITKRQYQKYGEFDIDTVERAFGSWTEAVSETNGAHTQSTWSNSLDNILAELRRHRKETGRLSKNSVDKNSRTTVSTIMKNHGEDGERFEEFIERHELV